MRPNVAKNVDQVVDVVRHAPLSDVHKVDRELRLGPIRRDHRRGRRPMERAPRDVHRYSYLFDARKKRDDHDRWPLQVRGTVSHCVADPSQLL